MTFVRRIIEATITLGKGKWGEDKGDTVKLSGLRMSAHGAFYGQESMSQIQLRVFGLPLDMIKRLTTIGPINTALRLQNRLVVQAGDEGSQLATIFDGTIDQAWGEFAAAPDVVLNIAAFSALKDALKPVPPLSFPGNVDAADVLKGLAATMGLNFENNGVSVILASPYYPGTALEQVRACTKAADISYAIDRGTMSIWPRKGARAGEIPLLSPARGLVGYPAFSSSGVSLVSMFSPTCVLGGKIRLESQLTPANGEWNVVSVVHNLECQTPNGQWFTHLECVRLDAA